MQGGTTVQRYFQGIDELEEYARSPFQFRWLYKELGLFPVGDMYRLDSSLTANVQPSARNLHRRLTHPHRNHRSPLSKLDSK